jgi:CIC family chloride channel protein
MIFSMEVILGDWSAAYLIPIAIAAVAGTEVSYLLQGNQIAFTHRQFDIDLVDTIACVGLAVITALASIGLTRAIRYMHRNFRSINLPLWLRAAIGGCIVGAIGIFLPVVLGEGYYSIRAMIDGSFQSGLAIVTIALVVKILVTALTLGSGGSGGIFAPSLVIGSFAGLTYHRSLEWLWPSVGWVNEGCYALLGMAGMVSSMLQAPLTGIFLIVEITGGYEVMLPLIIISAVSTTLCHYIEPASFYLRDLVAKGQLLRPGTDARVLSDLNIRELIEEDCITVKRTMLLVDFIDIIRKSRRNYFPVEDEQSGAFLGLIHMDDVRPYLFNSGMHHAVVMEQIMQTGVAVVEPDDDLEDVLQQMDEKGLYSMPVVTNNRFIGMISKATILDQYRKELMVQTCI